MKGYWYITAIAVIVAAITVYFETYCFIMAYLFWLFYLYYFKRLRKIPFFFSLAFLFFFLIYIPKVEPLPLENDTLTESVLSGEIISSISQTETKIEFILKENITKSKLSILYFPNSDEETVHPFKFGAECVLKGKVTSPNESRNPGQFDYRNYLLKQGIQNQFVVDSLDDIECIGSSFINKFFILRSNLIAEVEERVSPYTASWLNSLVLGDDSNLDKTIVKLFQKWGLTHIIAISGTHIALLLGFFYFIMIKLSILTKEKAQNLVIILLPIYAILAGGEPSVWRASIMVMIFILFNKLKFNYSVTDVLSLVFIFLIIMDPSIIYHVGFQLSFLVTFGILLSRNWILKTNNTILQALQISFVAQMFILPLQFSYFSIFQPLSILLNLLIIPYFSIIVIPFMYILLPLTFLPIPFIDFFDKLFIFVHGLVMDFIGWVDAIADLPWFISSFPIGESTIYYALFLLFMMQVERMQYKKAFIYGIYMTVFLFILVLKPYLSPYGTVTMLDIGQGDAYIIELPYRQGVIMIDAGAEISFENGEVKDRIYEQTIKPFLYFKGIQKIDALFLTHEDTDHVGSVGFLMDDIDVQTIYLPSFYEITKEEADLWKKVQVEVKRVGAGEVVQVNQQLFDVIGPVSKRTSANDNSLILFSEIGGLKWLFTGDIGKDVEIEIVDTYPNLDVDVLKVAHHGSNTSTDAEFLERVTPQVALISVGKKNRYGHPSKEVIERLEAAAITILRSDIHGAVQFRYRENTGTFFTSLP